nr:hypothetical protein [Tanacetum cinerariifolium]
MIAEMDQDADVVLEDDKEVDDNVKDVQDDIDESAQDQGRKAESQAEIYKIDLEHANKVLSMQEDEYEPAEVQEVVNLVTTANVITEVVTAASETITAASTTITAAEAQVPVATLTTAPARVVAALSRIIKGVDEVINHVKKKAKEDPAVKKYQALKRKPQTEAQARKNMMLYLKNVAGFKLDYFKGMSYDDIRPIFEAKFNSNVAFLQKTKEQIEEKESRALKRINETPAEKAAKSQIYMLKSGRIKEVYMVQQKSRVGSCQNHVTLNVVRLEVEEESEVSLELLSIGSTPTFLTPGQISSGIVPNSVPKVPYVPSTNKELEILFQPMFDEYLEPPRIERPVSRALVVLVPVNSVGTPSSTTIDQDAPSLSHSPSSSVLQSLSSKQGVAARSTILEDNPFAPIDNDPFVNVFALEPSFEALSSRDVSSVDSTHVTQPHYYIGNLRKDHLLDNVIGNPSRPVSTRKQLATDALLLLGHGMIPCYGFSGQQVFQGCS